VRRVPAERAFGLAAAALAAAGLVARVHNAFAYPALRDFDGAGHALNTFALLQGRLPDPRAWSGFHPPLAYALGAALWRVAPAALPVHVQLRLLSAACGALAVALTWRVLRRHFAAADAAAVAALAWCAPVMAIATSMMGNETLCALLATAALARLAAAPIPPRALRHALGTGALAGLSALAKSTGLLAIAAGALHYAVALRADARRAALAAAAAGGVGAALFAPHVLRLAELTGSSPLAVVSGGATSPDARGAMERQPPGVRRAVDYVWLPAATLLHPIYLDPSLLRSVPGLLYASTWADGHAQFLPPAQSPAILPAESALALAGLLPTGLALAGLWHIARDRRRRQAWLGPLVLLAGLALGFARYTWVFPQYAAVKASYFLPALLPVALALAAGLEAARGRARALLRAALLAIAAGSTALTWYGWWT
jgi:Dolichyl-phosphate-mannose-protein mannosyltransferase